MGLVVRQSIFITIISYVGVFIGYINVLYLFPKFLEPDQVGLLRSIQDAAILFSPFAQFGLAHSILRFYPQLVKDKGAQGGFMSLVLLLALGGFVIFFTAFKIFEAPIMEDPRSLFEVVAEDRFPEPPEGGDHTGDAGIAGERLCHWLDLVRRIYHQYCCCLFGCTVVADDIPGFE
jgi:hypothetical protein